MECNFFLYYVIHYIDNILTCDTTFFCAACMTALAMLAMFSSSGSSPAGPAVPADMDCSFISFRLKILKVSDKIAAPSASRGSSSSAKHAEVGKGKRLEWIFFSISSQYCSIGERHWSVHSPET